MNQQSPAGSFVQEMNQGLIRFGCNLPSAMPHFSLSILKECQVSRVQPAARSDDFVI